MHKICIVSTRHISYNPRVLKEADALSAAGYTVTVVTISNSESQAAFDEELMKRRSWALRTVNFRRRREWSTWLYLSVKQRIFGYLSAIGGKGWVAERAAEKAFAPLLRLARAEKADLYIAHHAEALGAAYGAAKSHGALFGFDAEDFQTGMSETGKISRKEKLLAFLEATYLPRCDYITAASRGIADAYREKYGLRQPAVVLNVFPYEDLPAGGIGEIVTFYWYSQVIGPNRGIELLLDAASRISLPFQIHLRGKLQSEAYRAELKARCGSGGLWERVVLHDRILAEALISDANRFDIGLALESDISVNRNICVTNKIFSYLMSRLLIIGTDTEGQKDIFRQFPEAARICPMKDASELASAMEFFILHRDLLHRAKKAAGVAARRFNWESESQKLLGIIKDALCQRC